MIKSTKLVRKLEKYIVFNIGKIVALTGIDRHYSAIIANRMIKQGEIRRLGRDIYTVKTDAFLIASHIYWPSYISMWSAIRYYNLTEQLPHVVSVVTPVRSRKKFIDLTNNKITFTLIKPKYFFGFKKIRYGEGVIFIAEKEKAFVDAVLFKKISFSEICDMIKTHKKYINFSKLISFTIKTGNKTLIKRFGFLAEKLGYDFYKRLKKFINTIHSPLDYSLPAKGKLNKKWRVIENMVIQ